MQRTRWALIGRGFAGWHADGVPEVTATSTTTCRGSGCYAATPSYAADAIEGAPVYDAAHLRGTDGAAAFCVWVYGPDSTLGSQGKVSEHVAALRAAVPGVRFGRVSGGRVVWDA